MEILENQIQHLENQLSSTSGSIQLDTSLVQDEINSKKEQLNIIIKSKTEGAIMRSRIKWYEEGETNSKYFFSLEKRTSNKKSINMLQLNNDNITIDPKTILQEMKHFNQTLYSPTSTADLDNFFEQEKQPVAIQPDDLAKIEKETTEQEILNIVKSLPNNKTQGEDRLPSEFYKFFWLDIKKSTTKFLQIFIWNWPAVNNTKTRSVVLNP